MNMFRKLVAIQAFSGTTASVLALIAAGAVTTPAAAQQDTPPAAQQTTAPASPTTPAPELPAAGRAKASESADIIVTGSHIRGSTYDSDTSIQFITKDATTLSGARTIAEVLQNAGVTSGTAQINNTFLGYVSEGGAGANTVGLLGLGSERTLVLLNGRRLSPAGVGPQLVSADLNVLPDAVLDHIEVLKTGASSVYGSDAVGGVINLITDTKMNGVTLDAYGNLPLDSGGDGANYRLSVTAGKVFDHGHIMGSFEFRDQGGIKIGARSDLSCPTDLLTDPTSGKPIGQLTPDGSALRCFPFANGAVGTAQDYILGINYFTVPPTVNRYSYVNGSNTDVINVNNANLRALASPRELDTDFYSPIRTYTGYLNGSYELGILGDAELYAEGLFTHRESHQDVLGQISINPQQLGFEIYGGGLAGYGYPSESPFFPNSLASPANGSNNALRVFIVPPILHDSQRVDFYRGNVGLRGDTGIGDIRYDANFQYSGTDASSTVEGIQTSRIRASLLPVMAPAGTPSQYVTTAIAGEAGAGNNYTCASNVTNGAYNGGNCVAADFFNPTTLAGNLPANLLNWLYTKQTETTHYDEQIAQLVFNGTLLQLPAGPVGFALGGEWRRDAIDDIPSAASQAGNLYNYSSSGITKGSSEVYEGFGEIKIPLLKDVRFAKSLGVTGSVRYTSTSYGSTTTYHGGGNWAPTDFLTFRGNYGTSFRAPNLFEQFVANQSGFSTATDPCANYSTIYAPTSTIYKNCQADLTQAIGAAAAAKFIQTGSPEVFTGGGGKNLKAENSTSWGGGFVIEPKFTRFQFAADYFNTTVKNEVSQLGDTIITRCFESTDFRNGNPYCALVGPRETVGGNLTTLENVYLNVAEQKVSGIDFNLTYKIDVGQFKNSLNVTATRIIHQIYQPFAEEAPTDYNGTLGDQGTAGGPKWVGNLRFQTTVGIVTVYYGANYVGPMGQAVQTPAVVNGVTAVSDLHTGKYVTQDLSVQIKLKQLGALVFGARNVFDRKPEEISSTDGIPRVGNYFNYSGYDFIGRSLFMELTKKF